MWGINYKINLLYFFIFSFFPFLISFFIEQKFILAKQNNFMGPQLEDAKPKNKPIDLLAIYTTEAKNYKKDRITIESYIIDLFTIKNKEEDRKQIESYIQDQVMLTNQILANSGLAHRRIRLVGMEEINYTQTDYRQRFSFFVDLTNLSNTAHKIGFHVKELRTHYNADLVHLFVPQKNVINKNTQICGSTYALRLDSSEDTKAYLETHCSLYTNPIQCKKDILNLWNIWSRSFSMSAMDCSDPYTFTHELGHSMGLHHDHSQNKKQLYTNYFFPFQNQIDDLFYKDILTDSLYTSYGVGYTYYNFEESKCMLSVMSSADACWKMSPGSSIEKIPIFSNLNPVAIGKGKEYPFGVNNKIDASRAIDENWDTVASFSDIFSSHVDEIIENFPFSE